jgi:dephospho-CoA kinase
MTPEPYVIGLTGNIATGKSTVLAMLAHLGACIVDADKLAHWVMRSGTAVNQRIVERFGEAVRRADGEIDRARLGAIVFQDAAALEALEAIVHPEVVAETLRRVQTSTCPVCVIEAIKLLEAQMHRHCQAVWVITSPRAVQVDRLMRTRGLSLEQAEQRIAAQPPVEAKLASADVVLDNGADLPALWRQVVAAWNGIPGIAPALNPGAWPPNLPEGPHA